MFRYLKKPIKIRTDKLVIKLNLIILTIEWHIELDSE
ncbi:Uncharacterised protein [Streptococcus suis]|uniref:Uncharacterized protein n=1 Tax=Streptococcus suis TaxID=1307 RepID=A0A0Z8IT33_STRSU|nr:Uncharacterised protein [Streptococcus suis]CYU25710.1 Uncharacterised protein [Streptococcus suis]CYV22621.1 Uncharacterised protein [Streptococcus suis]CYV31181.1 Uncharacterised protein [Streptococcus suis]CYV40152.1 Uncharacterised protein [Streptococcus suis]